MTNDFAEALAYGEAMAETSIAIAEFMPEVVPVRENGECVVFELASADADPPLLALAWSRQQDSGPTDRWLSFETHGTPTHFWHEARPAGRGSRLRWSYTQDAVGRPRLLRPGGGRQESVHPLRHELQPETAVRLATDGDTDVLIVSIGGIRPGSLFPFRLTSDVPIYRMSHLGAVADLHVAIAFASPGIRTLRSSSSSH